MRVGELRKRIEPKNAPLTVIRVLLFGVSSIFGLVAATTTLAQETKMELPKEKTNDPRAVCDGEGGL